MNWKITIDPGTNGTGWAVWDDKWNLQNHGVIIPKSEEWKDKMEEVTNKLFEISMMLPYLRSLHIEYPSVFGGGVAAQSGAVVKLAVLVGYISGRMSHLICDFITVPEWKGQLPKAAVIRRIKKLLPEVDAGSHDWDAIGIGLYKSGRF